MATKDEILDFHELGLWVFEYSFVDRRWVDRDVSTVEDGMERRCKASILGSSGLRPSIVNGVSLPMEKKNERDKDGDGVSLSMEKMSARNKQ
uniref:Uncharacterized protein n=1 Tax=Cannabis sativa TaxID=3483 RepID=A0A803Q2X0_CANSA